MSSLVSKRREFETMSLWSDLPRDMLERVREKLSHAHQSRMRLVCKAWSRVPTVPSPHLPCLIFWEHPVNENYISKRMLFDPFDYRSYKDTMAGMKIVNYQPSDVLSSKYGWLLIRPHNFWRKHTTIVLYSPFSGEIIDPPDLDPPEQDKHVVAQAACLSAPPTSSNCLLMVIMSPTIFGRYCTVRVCNLRGGGWRTFSCKLVWYKGWKLVYMHGSFYCLCTSGMVLMAFDMNEGSLMDSINIEVTQWFCEDKNGVNVVEYGGDILLVNMDKTSLSILKLDKSLKKWVEVESFDDKGKRWGKIKSKYEAGSDKVLLIESPSS